MPLLEAKNISIGYEGKVVAEGISFFLEEGDYLCVVGENGAGKSTLIKTLLGLQRPIKGDILFFEEKEGARPMERAEGVGYLSQQTMVQRDFPATVGEVVLSGCQNRMGRNPFYTGRHRKIARAAMERMEIENLERRSYRDLSGGQQQRVLLARALCSARRLLVLDEPVAGLDPRVTEEMYRLLDGLHEDGMTIIMISHDIAEAISHAGHILHIGRQVFFGRVSSYKESEVYRMLTGHIS